MPAQPDACLAALAAAFPPAALLQGGAIPARNLQDTSYLPPETPLAVLRPDTPQGVAEAVRICARHGVAVVPQGGLTGLAGGAHPLAGAVMLSLERLAGIDHRGGGTVLGHQHPAGAAGDEGPERVAGRRVAQAVQQPRLQPGQVVMPVGRAVLGRVGGGDRLQDDAAAGRDTQPHVGRSDLEDGDARAALVPHALDPLSTARPGRRDRPRRESGPRVRARVIPLYKDQILLVP